MCCKWRTIDQSFKATFRLRVFLDSEYSKYYFNYRRYKNGIWIQKTNVKWSGSWKTKLSRISSILGNFVIQHSTSIQEIHNSISKMSTCPSTDYLVSFSNVVLKQVFGKIVKSRQERFTTISEMSNCPSTDYLGSFSNVVLKQVFG